MKLTSLFSAAAATTLHVLVYHEECAVACLPVTSSTACGIGYITIHGLSTRIVGGGYMGDICLKDGHNQHLSIPSLVPSPRFPVWITVDSVQWCYVTTLTLFYNQYH